MIQRSDHQVQNDVPGRLIFEHVVGEHAAVPTEVLDFGARGTVGFEQPVRCAPGHVELAAGIVGRAMPACLVVVAAAEHRPIGLRNVEVERPRTQLRRHRRVGRPEGILGVMRLEQRMLRRVGTHQVVVRMCQIGLETDHTRHSDGFKKIQHVAPRVHACPADFALGGQPLAVARSDAAGLAEGLGDAGRVPRRIDGPVRRAVRRVDAHHTATPHTVFAQHPRNVARSVHRGEKAARRGPIAHRTTADGLGPDRCHDRPDLEAPRGDVVSEATDDPIVSLDVQVGLVQEQIHPVEATPLRHRPLGEIEHPIQRNRRMVGARLLPHQARPHRVVQFPALARLRTRAHAGRLPLARSRRA